MKSIIELIKVRGLIPPLKKDKISSKAIKNLDIETGLDDAKMKQVNKINKWFRQSDDALRPGYKILFDGSSAVAKTKAAKMIAKQNGLEIYRIKLSEVISKNIAETEKNLDKIVDDAANKNRILFFDEADALFGKRTNVKEAHDRYANQEISYLLQRLDAHNGLAIFNCKECNGSDKALGKYFQTVVHFPRPSKNSK
jgi:SpoVK/Ycf46/Vps4 family AAA+-type ATPase